MGDISSFIRDASFDPETLQAMSLAYDKARKSLRDRGQPEVVYEIIAERIIAFASKGERDPEKLAAASLHGIDQSRA